MLAAVQFVIMKHVGSAIFFINLLVVAVLGGYGFILSDNHLEFGWGVVAGTFLFGILFRVKTGHWP